MELSSRIFILYFLAFAQTASAKDVSTKLGTSYYVEELVSADYPIVGEAHSAHFIIILDILYLLCDCSKSTYFSLTTCTFVVFVLSLSKLPAACSSISYLAYSHGSGIPI